MEAVTEQVREHGVRPGNLLEEVRRIQAKSQALGVSPGNGAEDTDEVLVGPASWDATGTEDGASCQKLVKPLWQS